MALTEPPVGSVVEVGTVPALHEARDGDLLTFTRLPSGVWTERHNHALRDRPVTWEYIQWWAPWRVVEYGPAKSNGNQHTARWDPDARDEGEAA